MEEKMSKVRYLAILLFIACGGGESGDQGSGDNPLEFNEKCFPNYEAPGPMNGQYPILQEGNCEPEELDVLAYDDLCGVMYEDVAWYIEGCYWTGITEKGCEEEKYEDFVSIRLGDCVWEYETGM
jgi:hypothetical protein